MGTEPLLYKPVARLPYVSIFLLIFRKQMCTKFGDCLYVCMYVCMPVCIRFSVSRWIALEMDITRQRSPSKDTYIINFMEFT